MVNRTEVHDEVAATFARYRVGLMLCDPPKWYSELEGWQARYGEEVVLALDTNQARRFAPAVDRWLTGIREGNHTHDADPITDLHVKAAHLRKVRLTDEEDDGRTKYVLIKGDDGGRIDGAVADVRLQAAMTMPAAPARFVSSTKPSARPCCALKKESHGPFRPPCAGLDARLRLYVDLRRAVRGF